MPPFQNNIVNPAAVVADSLHQSGIKQSRKKVYLIGGQGIRDELKEFRIECFGDGPDSVDNQPDKNVFIYDLKLDEKMEHVGAVVVGYEKYFNYIKLMKAANYLQVAFAIWRVPLFQNEKCLFLATNEDETCPGPNPNTIIPDAGPIIAAVKVATGREPLVVGKPNTPAFDYIRRRWNIDPERTLMVGDRYDERFKAFLFLRTFKFWTATNGQGLC